MLDDVYYESHQQFMPSISLESLSRKDDFYFPLKNPILVILILLELNSFCG